ncbi:MAG: isoprenylcysteine carboxylmethyltransferase family protein [Desulfobulbaceae bacterium]|nr:isoprenylcysteine carboxylmethyltransferase family protein [Desulfobulbaceae bacterium]
MILRVMAWLIMLVGGSVLGFWLDLRFFQPFLYSPLFHILSLLPGIILLRLVLQASRNTGRFLARAGREGNIPHFETNRLVTAGYYACMRHPMHFGLLFFPLSIALILGSVSFILFIAPAEMVFMIGMIKFIEEPQAIRKFGQEYSVYKSRVPMFSLKWTCMKSLFNREKSGQDHQDSSR